MNSPLLSICIPTYNREKFLAWTLDKTVAAFPHAKIVVSDNASTDGTREVVKTAGARYIRQSSNIGAFPNMRAALLAASTQYCVFLGDDDYLVPEEVQKGMDFLEAHPEVSAYFAPCQLYDEVRGKPAWDAFYVASDVQCLTDFDSYRWGLEIMAFGLFSKAPDFEKMKPELQNMIRQFIWTRYEVAARLRTMNGKIPEAHELQMRMEMTRY
jgi:glycosyltransferase involved in cell wall biosynthesis